MVAKTLDSELAHWADLLERLRWVGALFDHDLRLVWVSPDLTRFLGFPPEDEIGYGRHVMEALSSDAWGQIATPESQSRFWGDLGPAFLGDALARGIALDEVPMALRRLVHEDEPKVFTRALATSFDYREPGSDS